MHWGKALRWALKEHAHFFQAHDSIPKRGTSSGATLSRRERSRSPPPRKAPVPERKGGGKGGQGDVTEAYHDKWRICKAFADTSKMSPIRYRAATGKAQTAAIGRLCPRGACKLAASALPCIKRTFTLDLRIHFSLPNAQNQRNAKIQGILEGLMSTKQDVRDSHIRTNQKKTKTQTKQN